MSRALDLHVTSDACRSNRIETMRSPHAPAGIQEPGAVTAAWLDPDNHR